MDTGIFSLSHYTYDISRQLIAQEPVVPRDSSRLLVLDRKNGTIKEMIFRDITELLQQGDVLVLNNTEVIKARLPGEKKSGSKIEVLLLKQKSPGIWEVLVKPGKRARLGDEIVFAEGLLKAHILEKTPRGSRIIKFDSPDMEASLTQVGKVPLPPYIKRELDDFGGYQTVYAKKRGAVAAPTAGLHFTEELIERLKHKGVEIVYITLHCGLATFRPVKTGDIREHKIESEWVEITAEASQSINKAKDESRRVIGVGTTSVRALESAAFFNKEGSVRLRPMAFDTSLYILPGYRFKIIDVLVTNFHTPQSTNLILVASFCGLPLLKKSYSLAKEQNFRFFSFGDAMFIH
jgi:S-adenosylmethionine:tRNA ribosyltransferase-isomerase